jgi:hypothetical protein
MFWNGERWIPENGSVVTSTRPARSSRLRRWLATLPILFLVPALVVPIVPAEAATNHPRVVIRGIARPGGAPTPAQTPVPALNSVTVSSILSLLSALADNSVTEIVVANGTYHVSPASSQRSDSLWIGDRFAGRTNPVTVRAETRGGVTFDGGGATGFGGLKFVDAAHDQTWDGFNFGGGQATDTGVIVFGGAVGQAGPHHITLRHVTILASCTGHNDRNDHGVYFSWSADGTHDVLLEDLTVDGSGPTPLASAVHFDHSDSANRNAWNVTVRRLVVTGTYQAVILWDSTPRNITIDGATITNARYSAVRYEGPGSGIILKDIVSTGSGQKGFYSSLGSNPPGVTFVNDSFR